MPGTDNWMDRETLGLLAKLPIEQWLGLGAEVPIEQLEIGKVPR